MIDVNVPARVRVALWVLGNGACYAPGCPSPVMVEVRPGVHRGNARAAHIHGLHPKAPRYVAGMSELDRESFGNLLLLCLAHHAEVTDAEIGAELYPSRLLLDWKVAREGLHGAALGTLGAVDEYGVLELVAGVVDAPLDRLAAIADLLEDTGRLTERGLDELRAVLSVLKDQH